MDTFHVPPTQQTAYQADKWYLHNLMPPSHFNLVGVGFDVVAL